MPFSKFNPGCPCCNNPNNCSCFASAPATLTLQQFSTYGVNIVSNDWEQTVLTYQPASGQWTGSMSIWTAYGVSLTLNYIFYCSGTNWWLNVTDSLGNNNTYFVSPVTCPPFKGVANPNPTLGNYQYTIVDGGYGSSMCSVSGGQLPRGFTLWWPTYFTSAVGGSSNILYYEATYPLFSTPYEAGYNNGISRGLMIWASDCQYIEVLNQTLGESFTFGTPLGWVLTNGGDGFWYLKLESYPGSQYPFAPGATPTDLLVYRCPVASFSPYTGNAFTFFSSNLTYYVFDGTNYLPIPAGHQLYLYPAGPAFCSCCGPGLSPDVCPAMPGILTYTLSSSDPAYDGVTGPLIYGATNFYTIGLAGTNYWYGIIPGGTPHGFALSCTPTGFLMWEGAGSFAPTSSTCSPLLITGTFTIGTSTINVEVTA